MLCRIRIITVLITKILFWFHCYKNMYSKVFLVFLFKTILASQFFSYSMHMYESTNKTCSKWTGWPPLVNSLLIPNSKILIGLELIDELLEWQFWNLNIKNCLIFRIISKQFMTSSNLLNWVVQMNGSQIVNHHITVRQWLERAVPLRSWIE